MVNFIKRQLAYFGIGLKAIPKRPFNTSALKTVKIGKFNLKLNKGHALDFYIQHLPDYNKALPRLVKLLKEIRPHISVIDIGANVGDTVAYIKNEADVPVICIEGDANYTSLLRKNTMQFSGITIFQQYLSEKEETISGNAVMINGTLSISQDEKGSEIPMITLDRLIKENEELFSTAHVLKVDTDGFDFKILRGAWNFLRDESPVLFFEYDLVFLDKQGEKGFDMLVKLADIGYNQLFFFDNAGRFMASMPITQLEIVKDLHNYIRGYKAPFEFYDICFFHKKDASMASLFHEQEKKRNEI